MSYLQTATEEEIELPSVELPVDRSAAAVRALWRCVLALATISVLILWDVRWRLLWNTDKATFLAMATVHGLLALSSLVLLVASIRWLLLAGWTGATFIRLGRSGLTMNLGPFGSRHYEGHGLRMGIDREIDPELIEMMPDDAFMPTIRHPQADGDLAPRIQLFAAIESEKLTSLVRPWLRVFGRLARA